MMANKYNMTHYRNYALHSNCFNQCYCCKYYVLEHNINIKARAHRWDWLYITRGLYYPCSVLKFYAYQYSYTVNCTECEGVSKNNRGVCRQHQLILPFTYIMGVFPGKVPYILCRTAV